MKFEEAIGRLVIATPFVVCLLFSFVAPATPVTQGGDIFSDGGFLTTGSVVATLVDAGTLNSQSEVTLQLDAGLIRAQSVVASQLDAGLILAQSAVALQLDAGVLRAQSVVALQLDAGLILTNQVITTTSVSGSDTTAIPGGRSINICRMPTTTSTSYTCSTTAGPGTMTGITATADATGNWFTATTTTTSGNQSGITTSVSWATCDQTMQFRTVVRTDSSLASRRYVGVISAGSSPTFEPTASGSCAVRAAGLFYGSAGTNANWWCCSCDGSNYTCTDTGLAVATSTSYTLDTDKGITNANVSCRVTPFGGATSTAAVAANIFTGSTAMGPMVEVRTTTTAAAVLLFGDIYWARGVGN